MLTGGFTWFHWLCPMGGAKPPGSPSALAPQNAVQLPGAAQAAHGLEAWPQCGRRAWLCGDRLDEEQ